MATNTSCPLGSEDQFGPRIDYNCRHFDFTLLFEDAIFHILPSTVFLLLIPFRIFSIARTPVKVATYRLALCKLALLSILTVLHLSFVIINIRSLAPRATASLAAGILNFIAVFAATFHSFLEDQRSTRPSDLLILYFSASAILSLPRLRTLWLISIAGASRGLWTAIIILTILVVPLESIGKKRFLRTEYRALTKEEETGFWSRSFFTWLMPFFRLGYSRVIHIRDMPEVDKDLAGDRAGASLEAAWSKRKGQKYHPLIRSSFYAYRGTLFAGVITRLFLTAFTFCQPFLITATVKFMQTPKTPQSERYGQALVGAYVLTYLGLAVSRAAFSRHQFRFTTMLRAGLMSMIFRQTVSLKADDLKDSAAVTLMGTDIERIVLTFNNLHQIWAAVLEVGIAIFLLQRQIASASVVPVVISIVCAFGVIPVSKTIGRAQTAWIERLQKRVAVTASMLADMKSIKMLGLSGVLSTTITELRRVELRTSEKFRKLVLSQILVSNLPVEFAPFATFVIYSIIAVITKDQTLTTTNAFTALSLIGLLTEPLLLFCQFVPNIVQGVACFKRIEIFCLKAHEGSLREHLTPAARSSVTTLNRTSIELADHLTQKSSEGIIASFCNAKISWSPDSDIVFKDLSLTIKRGITMVVGPVGCGKSCLMESILGETSHSAGTRERMAHGIAYCAQTPWMMNDTVGRNITGGLHHDPKWFDQVLWLCSLTDDVKNMPGGELYNIGSNGVGLSGGQRQRVALARAVYSRHRVVVLDDVFSGLDSKSVSQISSRLFSKDGHFRRNEISIILATHTSALIRHADELIVLADGEVLSQGPYEQVVVSSPELITKSRLEDDNNLQRGEESEQAEEALKPTQIQRTLDAEEDRLRQNGSWSVYKYYFERAGWVVVGSFVFATFTEAFCSGFTNIWFQWWVEANEKRPNDNLGMHLGVYALLFAMACIGLSVECWLLFIRIISATAMSLHGDLLHTSLRAPLSFFQSTDTGSITNRFSQDLNLVDVTLPSNAINFASNACACIVKLIILCVMGKYLATSVPLLVGVLFFVQRYYLRTSRQVRLLDIEAKAPIYTHFLETLKGVATIRAYQWEENFEEQATKLLNTSQKPHYMLACIQQWLALVLDLIVGALALIIVSMATSITDKFSPGAIGVSMVLVLGFNNSLATTIKNWTALETSIGAVARIREFAQTTPSEERELGSSGVPPERWPMQGRIAFESVTARYTKDGDATLKNLSLSISSGQKIAVCGPSGSGKTSFVLSLLQMIEVTEGKISIDGIDLEGLERAGVRSRINVIPQEPFFIPGSVRFNLDPHSRESSETIKAALDKVGLLGKIAMAGGLDSELDADGFSVGERQLLALTRALVERSQILILDEATSSVDQDTEDKMQRIVEEEFLEQTVISVIHRLRFIENNEIQSTREQIQVFIETPLDMARKIRLGIITPSSNTSLEPLTQAIISGLPDVTVHFSRFRVLKISLDEDGLDQFQTDNLISAAQLLADAEVDMIGWSGTSSGWLGFEADEKLCADITAATGIPATTSVLALNKALQKFDVKDLGLVTPYTDDVQGAIIRNYSRVGVSCQKERHLDLTVNSSFGRVDETTLDGLVSAVATQRPEAMAIFCTNLRAAQRVAFWEDRHDILILDTVITVIWDMLRESKVDMKPLGDWGKLFSK
ncbi:ABC transporter [Colletotrichum melonis]|uniref:ABC transporter n=1 Tax=Colletotrichum melonis TaxID=1209925 RepID=A0AAI9UKI4_9PEZI|nr:ABC transporter [Colletotrichum melonis]